MRAALFALSVLLLWSPSVLAQSATTPAACDALRQLQLWRGAHGHEDGMVCGGRAAAGRPRAVARPGGDETARVLPPRWRDRSACGRAGGNDLRHRVRARASGELERTIPVPGRRRPERLRRQTPLGASGRAAIAGARARLRRRQHRHRTHRDGRLRRQLQAGPAGEPRLRVRGDRPRRRGREAHHRAALRQAAGQARTSPAAPPAAARRC